MKNNVDKSAIFFLVISLFMLLVNGYSFWWLLVAIINTILICLSQKQKEKSDEQAGEMDQNIQNEKDNLI
ncbi:hypothetical protein [Acetobacterium wieringae]|uniref:hypothetical protein n=1 Tax=Acetobacterium wieringae TaxID=52694 RepID=UPI0026ECB31A|nr:hypothetical protein [Acetobacterium wieringae]